MLERLSLTKNRLQLFMSKNATAPNAADSNSEISHNSPPKAAVD